MRVPLYDSIMMAEVKRIRQSPEGRILRGFCYGDDYMPRKPKRPCSYPGCPNLTDGRYCPEHQQKVNSNYEKYGRDLDLGGTFLEGNGYFVEIFN